MRHLRLIAGLAATFALGAVVGCFREGPPAPAFRFSCESDDDCESPVDDEGEPLVDEEGNPYVERCIAGLCQFSCSGSILDLLIPDAEIDCPSDRQGYVCFNGTCNHLCDGASDPSECSAPQTCFELSRFGESEVIDALSEQLPQERPGICGIPCDDADALPCPEGQLCIDGACLGLGIPDDTTTGSTGE